MTTWQRFYLKYKSISNMKLIWTPEKLKLNYLRSLSVRVVWTNDEKIQKERAASINANNSEAA